MDVLDWLLHYWPIISTVVAGVGGWLVKAVVDYHHRDVSDHKTLQELTKRVANIEKDVSALKWSHVAELQESLYEGHQRLVVHGGVKTIETNRRYAAIYKSLSELDDEDKTYEKLWKAIDALPIYTPEKEVQ